MDAVLIVEDEAVLRKYLARLLTEAGFDVATAATRAEAEARLGERRFVALLLDVKLPDGDGLDLLSALPPDQRPRHTVVMTAHATPDCAQRARCLRVSRLLCKPFELEDALGALGLAAPIAGAEPAG